MRAAVISNYGPANEVFSLTDPDDKSIKIPEITLKSDLIVQVAYAGVNPIDYKLRSGSIAALMPLKFPCVLGLDFSGTIVKGSSNEHFKPGTKVYGKLGKVLGQGTCAEFIRVNQETDAIARLPETLTLKEAAGVGVAALTSYTAFMDYLKVPKMIMETSKSTPKVQPLVLIIGASGGTGTFAVQLAKVLGVRAIAVCSGKNAELVKKLGAWHVLDYQQAPLKKSLGSLLEEIGQGLDGIIDLVGGDEYYLDLQGFIKKGGTFVTATGPHPPGGKASIWFLVKTIGSFLKRNLGAWLFGSNAYYYMITGLPPKYIQDIDGLFRQGLLQTAIHAEFPLKNIAKAHEESEKGRSVGKIVIKIE